MQDPTLQPTIEDQILDIFKGVFGETFKLYAFGDPIIFGKSELPAFIVEETTNTDDAGPTGMDDITHTVLIKVVFNKRDEIGKPAKEAGLARTIKNIVEGKDKTTGFYSEKSIKGVLRTKFTLNGMVYNQVGQINYDTVVRPEDQLTREGLLTVTINTLTAVPVRT